MKTNQSYVVAPQGLPGRPRHVDDSLDYFFYFRVEQWSVIKISALKNQEPIADTKTIAIMTV